MRLYRNLKFKMKLGYECWKQDCKLSHLVIDAINKTIQETQALAIVSVQKYLDFSDGTPEYLSSHKEA